MSLPAIVTLLALLEYQYFSFQAGMGREKFGVAAPATSGNEEWERIYRVQQNTLEQLIFFIPALWIFAYFLSPAIGAGIGVVFLVGRLIYAAAYVKNPPSRSTGFVMGFLANMALLLGGLFGAIRSIVL